MAARRRRNVTQTMGATGVAGATGWTEGMGAGTTTGTARGRGSARTRTQQFGTTRVGNSDVTSAANIADRIVYDAQEFGLKLSPVQARALKHSINVRLGIV